MKRTYTHKQQGTRHIKNVRQKEEEHEEKESKRGGGRREGQEQNQGGWKGGGSILLFKEGKGKEEGRILGGIMYTGEEDPGEKEREAKACTQR